MPGAFNVNKWQKSCWDLALVVLVSQACNSRHSGGWGKKTVNAKPAWTLTESLSQKAEKGEHMHKRWWSAGRVGYWIKACLVTCKPLHWTPALGKKTKQKSLLQVFSGPCHTNYIGNSALKSPRRQLFRLPLEEMLTELSPNQVFLQNSPLSASVLGICSGEITGYLGQWYDLVLDQATWYHQKKILLSIMFDLLRPQISVWKAMLYFCRLKI